MRFKVSRSARRHKIGRAHLFAALANAGDPDRDGELLRWIAPDDRGIELEIFGRLAKENHDLVIIIHVMPTNLRKDRQ